MTKDQSCQQLSKRERMRAPWLVFLDKLARSSGTGRCPAESLRGRSVEETQRPREAEGDDGGSS